MKTIKVIAIVLLLFSLVACQTAEQELMPKRLQVQDLRDDDGDGVGNARDICADSPADSLIDNQGCAQWIIKEKFEDFLFEFDYNKDVIRQNDVALFVKIINLLDAHPGASVFVVGDTSNEGGDDYNRALGLRRADQVIENLKQYGVDESTIIEFVYSDERLTGIMKKRRRRTIVRIVYFVKEHKPKWDIYTVENQRNEK
jgi:OOP family OmpA-OmpF porin